MLLLLLVLLLLPVSVHSRPPNVVVYLADDLGMGEVNQGTPYAFPTNPLSPGGGSATVRPANPYQTLRTPHLKRLAVHSTRYLLSYSGSSTCTPSRASFFISRNSGTVVMRDNFNFGPDHLNIDLQEMTFVEVLRNSGRYHTALVGKWGLGSYEGAPWNHGFDYFLGQLSTEQAWSLFPYYVNYFSRPWFTNSVPPNVASTYVAIPNNTLPLSVFSLATCTDTPACAQVNDIYRAAALQFIANHSAASSAPFFLMWTTTSPHIGSYPPGAASNALTSPSKRLGWRVNSSMDECENGHGAQIEQHVDQDIGALLDLLESSAYLNETLLVFTSDNGPAPNCVTTDFNYLSAYLSQGGLRGYKTNMFEGGLRVPTMVRWPGQVLPNATSSSPHTIADIGRTLIDLAGLNPDLLPQNSRRGALGGAVSLKNLWLQGDQAFPPKPWMYFEICPGQVEAMCLSATYNSSNWGKVLYKLVYNEATGNTWLSNLVADPVEAVNLAGLLPDVVNELMALRSQARDVLCPYHRVFTLCSTIKNGVTCKSTLECTWCAGNRQTPCMPGELPAICTNPRLYEACDGGA